MPQKEEKVQPEKTEEVQPGETTEKAGEVQPVDDVLDELERIKERNPQQYRKEKKSKSAE